MSHRATCRDCEWSGDADTLSGAAREADEHRQETGHDAKVERDLATDGGVLEREVVHDLPREEPHAPDDAAAYLVDALDRQDAETLREVAAYALRRAAWLDRDLEPEELADSDEEIVEEVESESGKGSVVEKLISCGKASCSSCPHGPYRYRQWREGDKVRSEYLGPA